MYFVCNPVTLNDRHKQPCTELPALVPGYVEQDMFDLLRVRSSTPDEQHQDVSMDVQT